MYSAEPCRTSPQDFSPQALLPEVREYFQRGGEGVAGAGCQEREIRHPCFEQLGQEFLEDALGATRAHIYYIKLSFPEIVKAGTFEIVSSVGKNAAEESIRKTADGSLVVQAGSYGID